MTANGGVLVSICVMTYNRLGTLKDTVDSLLPDVLKDPRTELVICDNASDDGTEDYCVSLAAAHPRVRYHRSPENRGFDGNVVACITHATGRFLWFFSDDDLAPHGVVARVVESLEREDPTVLYVNHFPFDRVAGRRDPMKQPALDQRFDDGRQYFLFAGLGFLSALTVRTDLARKYVGAAKMGPGQAHLDVVSRICLLETGPFLYEGSIAVAAGVSVAWRADWLRGCAIEETKFYQGLANDGLLDAATVAARARASISTTLLGLVLAFKCLGDDRELRRLQPELISVYGRYWQFWGLVYPALVIPRALLQPPYLAVRSFRRRRRQINAQ